MTTPSKIEAPLVEGDTKATAERNLQAECVWRGKRLLEVRDALTCINDELEDEGDRVYFASTNHADRFRETVEMLEEFGWSQIIKDKSKPDYIADLRQARDKNRVDAALIKELVEALTVLREEADSFSVSGVYFNEDCFHHRGIALADAVLAKAVAP